MENNELSPALLLLLQTLKLQILPDQTANTMEGIKTTGLGFFNRNMIRLEKFSGLAMSGMITGLILLVLCTFFTSPRWELFYHGKGYSELSEAPFDLSFNSSLRYRILAPLLGYLLFLKGPLFKYFMLAVYAAFLSLIYIFHRKKGFSPAESCGVAALLAFSTLSFYQLYFPAYTDPLSYVLLLCILIFHRKRSAGGILTALLLFNHDNTIFLYPFLFLLFLEGDYSIRKIYRTLGLLLWPLALYGAYRYYISTQSEAGFDTAYYFSRENMRWTWDRAGEHLWFGIFQAFRLVWIFPLLALIIDLKEKRYAEILLIMSCLVFVNLQFVIAYDISRLAGLSFPALLLSLWRVREYSGSRLFMRLLSLIFILNLWVPAYCVGALEPMLYPSLWSSLLDFAGFPLGIY
jgi:hypothetical protein